MKLIHKILKPVVGAACLVCAMSLTSAAQQADENDPAVLLDQLQSAAPDEAVRIERQLNAAWGKSGSSAMDLLLRRGQDAMERGDTAAAIEHLTALTDHAPDFAEGWHSRAMAYYQAELFGPALADLEQALSLNPNHFNALFGLGAMLEVFGKPHDAYAAYQQVQALHPHHEDAAESIARLRPQVEGKTL